MWVSEQNIKMSVPESELTLKMIVLYEYEL